MHSIQPADRSTTALRPHVIMHLADDLGYYHVGFNARRTDAPSTDVAGVTPYLMDLAQRGIILTRHYVHWHCSPSRRAFLSGRLPIHHSEGLSGEAQDDMDLRWKARAIEHKWSASRV